MSVMNTLDAALTELSAQAEGILESVKAIRELLGSQPDEAVAESKPEPRAYTIEEVRAVLLEKRKAGYKDEIKALLVRHGAERLTDIDPSEYAAMMREAEDIGA